MDLTVLQIDLLQRLRLTVDAKPSRRVVYCTEWLGYLPFGLYHWIEAEGQDVSQTFPWEWYFDWCQTDLEALASVGLLVIIDEWKNPNDDCETRTTYEVSLPR